MAHTAPTVDDFKTRFPKFESADDDVLAAILAEVLTQVDDSWLEQDYAPAIMYLMAHLYVQETTGSTDRPGVITSESLGSLSVSYGVGASNTDWDTTEYGRRFRKLQKKNFPAVAIASTG